jgi:hypothetical protein
MHELIAFSLTARQWESTCHVCRSPLFFGDAAFMAEGVGLVCCSAACAERLAIALNNLEERGNRQ